MQDRPVVNIKLLLGLHATFYASFMIISHMCYSSTGQAYSGCRNIL